jgi:hypothetical protein
MTVIVSLLFFWVLESRKGGVKKEGNELAKEVDGDRKEPKVEHQPMPKRKSTAEGNNPIAESWPQIVEETVKSRNTTPKRRRSSKKPLTPEEQLAMQDWERQLNEVAERRLRESHDGEEDLFRQGAGDMVDAAVEISSTMGLSNNAFDNQSVVSGAQMEQQMGTNILREWVSLIITL